MQKLIFNKPEDGIRKIVLATNIAETSITIDDVVFVIDCGKAKETSYDALNNTPCLLPSWISKVSAKQVCNVQLVYDWWPWLMGINFNQLLLYIFNFLLQSFITNVLWCIQFDLTKILIWKYIDSSEDLIEYFSFFEIRNKGVFIIARTSTW